MTVHLPSGKEIETTSIDASLSHVDKKINDDIRRSLEAGGQLPIDFIRKNIPAWSLADFRCACAAIVSLAGEPAFTAAAIECLTLLNDRHYATGDKKRKHIIHIVRETLHSLFSNLPGLDETAAGALPADNLC